ncbi:MAG: hypothetical protein ABIK28_12475, partial [Planctomycetota bacterium]
MTGMNQLDVDRALKVLKKHFLNRTDKVAILAPWSKPCPVSGGDNLDALLRAHVQGHEAPEVKVLYSNSRGQGAIKGRYRIGSYAPDMKGKVRWLCIDVDGGEDHADALEDPEGCAREIFNIFKAHGFTPYLERSGGGCGWHIWVFFNHPLPAKKVRNLAFSLIPSGAPLVNGKTADPRRNRGIEIFPKQHRIGKKGYGNLVWLPWWSGARSGGNSFYTTGDEGKLVLYVPGEFMTADEGGVDQAVGLVGANNIETREKPPDTHESIDSHEMKSWREQALRALPLDEVYGAWLTGRKSGDQWLECRDPESPSGDQNPSAGVADGTGEMEIGVFHSFRSSEHLSVFDFLVARGRARDFSDALRVVAKLSG